MKKAFAIILLAAITLSACTPNESSTQAETVLPETTSVSGILVEAEKAEEPSPINNPIQEEVNQTADSAEEDTDAGPILSTSISSPTPSVEEPPKESKPTGPTKPQTEEAMPDETQSAETQPTPTEPEVTESPVPEEAEPAPTNPEPTIPVPTVPVPTDPEPTDPAPTEPEVEQIDIAALESYGRSYASSAYGYKGTSACGPGSGAGYFPGATKQILTMADGYSLVCQAIDAQYYRDAACGYSPYEEIDGVTVRCPINIRVEATGEPNMYVIWVYYGGSA